MLTRTYRARRARFGKRVYDPTDSSWTHVSAPKRSRRRADAEAPPTPPALVARDGDGAVDRWRRVKHTTLIQKRRNHKEWRVSLPPKFQGIERPSFRTLEGAVDFCNAIHETSIPKRAIDSSEAALGTIDVDAPLDHELADVDLQFDIEALFDSAQFEPEIEAARPPTPPAPSTPPTSPTPPTPRTVVREPTRSGVNFAISIVPNGTPLRPQARVVARTAFGSGQLSTEFQRAWRRAFDLDPKPTRRPKREPLKIIQEMRRFVPTSLEPGEERA